MTGANGAGGVATPLRILVVHRYYWPDTPPCASLLRRIAAHLRQDGHQVDVLSSQPSYRASAANERRPKRDVIDDVAVERLTLPTEVGRPIVRILNALRLGTSLLYRALTRRYDVIVISTVPPVLGGFSAALAARLSGARFIYHAMDIHPEIGKISGEFARPLIFKTLRNLDSWSCRQADPVVVLSRDMEKTLRGRAGGGRFRVEVLNNFPLPDDGDAGRPEELGMGSDRLTVIYAGNLGRFQGLQTIVEAMEKLSERTDIELLLMGDGVAKSELEAQAKRSGAKVRFLGSHPVETAKAAIRRADIGFVSLIPEMYRYAYPSKTMAYLEQGCPIIAAVEEESDLATQIRDQRCGFAVPPGDSDRLAGLLASLADDSEWKAEMKENASRVFESEFSEEKILRRWSDLAVEGRAQT